MDLLGKLLHLYLILEGNPHIRHNFDKRQRIDKFDEVGPRPAAGKNPFSDGVICPW